MNDKIKIAFGLLVFLALITFPVWYALLSTGVGAQPQLELPAGETKCVESKEYMIANHMNLLDEWRDLVVRQGEKTYTSRAYGDVHEMSLTGTCLKCHSNRENFCDKCHTYADVKPYCWDCHVDKKL